MKFTSRSSAWAPLCRVLGQTAFPDPLRVAVDVALAKLSEIVRLDHPTLDQVAAGNAIKDKATEIYKLAGVPLATAIGTYCSYCETALPGLTEVEHIASESQYPSFITTWNNFLLACSPCNTAKRARPTRVEAAEDPPPPPLNSQTSTDQQFSDKISSIYHWPDLIDTTFQGFPAVLYYFREGGSSWQPLFLPESVNLDEVRMTEWDLATREIRADLSADLQNVHVGVFVYDTYGPAPSTEADLVGLCGLNEPGNPDSTFDRRLFNRTRTWFTALDVLRSLRPLRDPATFNHFWPTVRSLVEASGFWSVWVRVFSQFLSPEQKNLGELLYTDPPANFFPGTNTETIQLPPIQ